MARVSGHVFLVDRKAGPQWYAKYRLPSGKQLQKRLGPAHTGRGRCPAGHLTERTAKEALDAILTDARRGTRQTHDEQAAAVTFQDAAAEYLRFIADVRKRERSTVNDYRGVIDGYLVPEFGPRAIDAITPDDIDVYKERLIAERRLSNRTIVRHLSVLHGIFKRARRVWKLVDNPASADYIERPQVVYTGAFDTFTWDEVELLATHAESRQEAALYRTAAYTGLRQGELLALKWADVDFLDGLVHVRRNYTDRTEKVPKGKKAGSVPLMPALASELGRLKDREHFTTDADLVFPNEIGGHLCSWSLRRRYYKALQRAGLRKVRFHDLRHAFGSAAIKKLDPNTVQAYMRHAHYSTTQRYLHHKPRPEHARQLEEAFRESNVLPFSGHARDTPQPTETPVIPPTSAIAGKKGEAPTGIEPVYTALQAAA
jgi:integrase